LTQTETAPGCLSEMAVSRRNFRPPLASAAMIGSAPPLLLFPRHPAPHQVARRVCLPGYRCGD
jgi:hypothetical protein